MVKPITLRSEQFGKLVRAIAQGKYSWACMLFLEFVGYNPLDYIPCRTYYRLVKENAKGS
jgi:hypothetical protein